MINSFFYNQIISKLEHTPTQGQIETINSLSAFFEDKNGYCVFLLTGFAGTGKTTLISSLIKVLHDIKIKSVLLAPTGRAAKVLSSYSGHNASTIHKCIYRKKNTKQANSIFDINYNPHKNTIFIVDESSMIGNIDNNSIFGSGRLLDDLLNFVFSGNNCRLIFLGDTAQLPPIGTLISPALDKKELESMDMKVYHSQLYQVVRQSVNSGILYNATIIRNKINNVEHLIPKLKLDAFNDIITINGTDLIEEIDNSYSKYGLEETKIICKTNKFANNYNIGIRNRILYYESEICNGDLLMVVKNNYSWLPEDTEIDFIANGDILKVIKVGKTTEIYGYRYIDLVVNFVDFPELEIGVKVILDSLTIDAAGLDASYYKNLYNQLLENYSYIANKKKQNEAIMNDPYFNALQVKFGYAITCHKSQGGQWKSVFLDHGWIDINAIKTSAEIRYEFLRWLYTAFTRASEKLYLVNFWNELLIF